MNRLDKLIKEVLLEKKKKRDRCLRIADRKFDKPSAYKSGAVVRCRKGDIWKDIKEDKTNKNTHNIILTFDDERRISRVKTTPVFQKMLAPNQISNLKVGDNKLVVNNVALNGLERMASTGLYIIKKDIKEADDPQAGKAAPYGSGYAKVKQAIQELLQEDESLHKWFSRKGAKGKSKGWVDCNAPDGKGGYKACGRKEGEKRSKYPACRPTPAGCKDPGKGTKWGKTK
jgi:hypothetical protein